MRNPINSMIPCISLFWNYVTWKAKNKLVIIWGLGWVQDGGVGEVEERACVVKGEEKGSLW